MYATYVSISVILILLGIVSSVYFVRFLKNSSLQNITVPIVTESLNTFLIGLFYLYCAIVMAQHMVEIQPTATAPDENEVAVMEENTINVTEPQTAATKDFLLHYQTLVNNAIAQKHKKQKQIEPLLQNTTTFSDLDCFEQAFMEHSMFLYSFLHCVLTLVVKCSQTEESEKKSLSTVDKLCGAKTILAVKIVAIFLIPIVCIIALYFALYETMSSDLTKLYDFNESNDRWTIIAKPINVTIPEKTKEINDVVSNIYAVLNRTRETSQQSNNVTKRRPKQMEECANVNIFHYYTLLIFLIYFITILHAKINQMQIKSSSTKCAKLVNISIIVFGVLWLLIVMEMFIGTNILNVSTSSLREGFLTLGNFNHLSNILINYRTVKEALKKYNLVGPQA